MVTTSRQHYTWPHEHILAKTLKILKHAHTHEFIRNYFIQYGCWLHGVCGGCCQLHLKLQKLEVLRAGGHCVNGKNRHSWTPKRKLEPMRTVWKPRLFLLPLTLPRGAQHTLSPESDQLNVRSREKKPSWSQAQPHTIQERQQNTHRSYQTHTALLTLVKLPETLLCGPVMQKHGIL